MRRRYLRVYVLCVAAASLLAACPAEIGDVAEVPTQPADATSGTDAGAGGDILPGGDASAPVPSTPQRKTIHRLNRAEYDNTIRWLFYGLDVGAAEDFPPDDHGAGFDNIADVLALSPLLVELLERAADAIVTEALYQPIAEPAFVNREAEGPDTLQSVGGSSGDFWNLWSNGTVSAVVQLPAAGSYTLSARVACQQAGPDTCVSTLMFDGLDVQAFDVTGTNSDPDVISVQVTASAGSHTIGVSFTNDFYDPANGLDQNLLVDWVRIEGPTDLEVTSNPVREAIIAHCVTSSPGEAACLQEIVESFGKRAWRRPLSTDEVVALVGLGDEVTAAGGDWEAQLGLVLKALILSPHFIFRVELDTPDPSSLEVHPLTDHELATRLAYFLWSSAPDTELLTLADEGQLQDPAVIATQVERMLADPKAMALVDNFAGQWLYIRAVPDKAPDVWYYPDYDDPLQAAQQTELHMFVERYLFEDRDMLYMLVDSETFVNQRLAEHYGLDSSGMNVDFQLVDLSATGRKGLFGKSGLMTVLAHPTRTSPVKRGKWVLEQLMCDAPPDPPPGVEGLLDEADPTGKTLRELMEQHREDPYCASCHNTMDPIGLGLENYDGTGAWRETDNGLPVDASGELPGGLLFADQDEMLDVLLEDPRLPDCIVEKLFIYAMGRDITEVDGAYLTSIADDFAVSGNRFAALATALATSDAFRMRRGETEPTGGP